MKTKSPDGVWTCEHGPTWAKVVDGIVVASNIPAMIGNPIDDYRLVPPSKEEETYRRTLGW